jgi:TM2 domain-containing membrane protein YozV
MMFEAGKKSVGAAYLLWIFTGGLGGHRFYVGRPGMGVVILVMTLLGLLTYPAGYFFLLFSGILVIVDAFQIPQWINSLNVELANRIVPSSPQVDNPPPLPTAPLAANATPGKGTSSPLLWAIGGIVLLAALGSLSKPPAAPPPQVSAEPLQWSAAVLTDVASPPPAPALQEIGVPSDMTGRYYAQSIKKIKPGLVRIVSQRDGPSGTIFTHRECGCATATYRTLGTGDTIKEMTASPADPGMSKLVMGRDGVGSSSFHVCEHACSAIGSRLDRSQTR